MLIKYPSILFTCRGLANDEYSRIEVVTLIIGEQPSSLQPKYK